MTESKAVELLKNNEERRTAGTYIVVKHLSIIALEKQIPKKPKIKRLGCDIEWWCPNCGENHILMNAKKGFEYCHYCGQKLK